MEYSMTKTELYSLVLQAIEGRILENDFVRLEKYLQENAECREIYSDLNIMYAYLRRPALTFNIDEEQLSTFDATFWQKLAEYEKTAPEIEIPQEDSQRELIQKVVYPPRERHKISKLNIFTLAMSAAAILFLVLFLKFAPEKQYSFEVATLVDQMNTQWPESYTIPETGSRLWTNKPPLYLKKGMAKIQFDNGVDVIVEGPVVFEVERLGIYLEYGRMYGRVPKTGLGFTVNTPTCQFIDMGTEFGVQADVNNSSELHVIKGKVQLFAGSNGGLKIAQMVTENNAIRFNANNGQVKTIPVEKNVFVRNINSAERIFWRGQTEFNLADVVGGGNGFGTGQLDEGISLSDGAMETDYYGVGLRGTGEFIPVSGSNFVDGVFVPGVTTEPVRISSKGHIFAQCPATSGFYTVLKNGGIAKEWEGTVYPLELNGQVYGTPENPVLVIRSNAGITFDLDAIRNVVPGCKLKAFRSVVGISSNTIEVSKLETTQVDGQLTDVFSDREGKIGMADVFVLVDGQLKQTASLACDPKTIVNMNIKLTPQDRFLTLVSTQGDNEWTHDWVMFTKARLVLSTVE